MKKRGVAAFIAAVFVVALGFLLSFFSIFADRNSEQYSITLPGQGSALIDPSPELGEENRQRLQEVQLDRTNVQAVVGNLLRPEAYTLDVETTYFYRDKQSEVKSKLWHGPDMIRIEQLATTSVPAQQILISENWVYIWHEQDEPVRFPRQAKDDSLYQRMPIYEDILKMPAEAIIEGKLEEWEDDLCIIVKTQDQLTGETEQWYILAENGLLVLAEGSLEGKPTYRTQITNVQLSLEDSEVFKLPDGALPE